MKFVKLTSKIIFSLPIVLLAVSSIAQDDGGEELYQQRCALCHDNPQDYIPPRGMLELRSANYVINAMTSGSMQPQAAGLDAEQIESIAVYVTGKQVDEVAQNDNWDINYCEAKPQAITEEQMHWNGWGRELDNSRYQPDPGFSALQVPRLKVKWAFAYPSGRHNSQPVIVGERIFVATAPGYVYSLDANNGCVHWVYDPQSGVRSTVSVGVIPGSSPAQYAVFMGTTDRYAHAVDAQTGKLLWKTELGTIPEARVTGSVAYYDGIVFVPLSSFEETAAVNPQYECCKFRGNVAALEAATGKVLWQAYAIPEPNKPTEINEAGTQMFGPAGAAIWSAPTVDPKRGLVYAATGDSYTDVPTTGSDAVIAFSIKDGSTQWLNQVTENDNFLVGCRPGGGGHANCPEELGPDFDFGSSPILRSLDNGRQVLLAGQKSGIIYAMDADDDGKILWQKQLGSGGPLGGIQWGSAADEEAVYVPVADLITPAGPRRPGLTALDIDTGEELWHVDAPEAKCSGGGFGCSNGLSAAVSVIPGVVFAGSLDGRLRAFSTKDGTLLWEFDTTSQYDSVNGVKVQGGSINATGPTFANGTMFMNTGYGGVMNAGGGGGGQAGNVLLAFTVDGK